MFGFCIKILNIAGMIQSQSI
uniref:Uncharacterized protein n=1 Tax=Anguilla anguilla TaxID=7936 RepID=A0A0E9P6M1_ANGAN